LISGENKNWVGHQEKAHQMTLCPFFEQFNQFIFIFGALRTLVEHIVSGDVFRFTCSLQLIQKKSDEKQTKSGVNACIN